MISIKGFPFLHEDECNDLFSAQGCFTGDYLVKPIYRYFPNTDGLDVEEKEKYKFKNVKEGLYLVGLEVISDGWVNKGFCGMLLKQYGLVLREANPIVKKCDRGDENSLIYLNFYHIAFAVYSENVSAVS